MFLKVLEAIAILSMGAFLFFVPLAVPFGWIFDILGLIRGLFH